MEFLVGNIRQMNTNQYRIKEEKLRKINKLKLRDDKNRSLLGEMLFIEGIKRFYIEDYNCIDIIYNKNGKPMIKDKAIYYNIAHSKDYVICVFSDKEIGCDIEKVRELKRSVIRQFTSLKEREYIFEEKHLQDKRALIIFTLKEAYIKMQGWTLKDLLKVEFWVDEEQIICSDKQVKAMVIEEIPEYIIAICEKI